MSIVDVFNNHFSLTSDFQDADLLLVYFKDDIYVGKSNMGDTVVAVKADDSIQNSMIRKTALVSVECNMHMQYIIDGYNHNGMFHLIKCFSKDQNEINLFLEMAMLMIAEGDKTRDGIISTFQVLSRFFEDKNEPGDNELNGLYAELFAIYLYHNSLNLGRFWQRRDQLKYDFSITDKVKVEVKATTKPNRIHHFIHEQLAVDLYHIYILSFMLIHDDEGLSLLELINICKPLVEDSAQKVMRLNRILKNVDKNRLSSVSYEEDLTKRNLKIVRGEDVPKFTEEKPEGVTNAEYDCDFENISSMTHTNFINTIQREMKQ